VLHEVKYGQTLWSIAIQYGTTIIKIRQLNNLANDVLQPGQKLLVMRGATQTAPDQVEATPIPASVDYAFIITPVPTISPTLFVPTVTVSSGEFIQQNGMVISFLIISFAFLLVGMGIMGKRRS
jgi:murein DD-endopeptidase MepM/ murein hydrolase activator NlpD